MSEKNRDIKTLRNTLFDVLDQLKDKQAPMDLERAQAINNVAQTIINSAKVEVEALKVFQGTADGTDFIPVTMMETVPGTGIILKRTPVKHPAKK